jgi:hypothetical protein
MAHCITQPTYPHNSSRVFCLASMGMTAVYSRTYGSTAVPRYLYYTDAVLASDILIAYITYVKKALK